MNYLLISDTIHIIYLGILILGVILFSILNFRVLKDIKNSFNEYKTILEKNLGFSKDIMEKHNRKDTKLERNAKEDCF